VGPSGWAPLAPNSAASVRSRPEDRDCSMPTCMSSMCRSCVDPGFVRAGMVSCGFVGALLVSRHRAGRSVLLCLRS